MSMLFLLNLSTKCLRILFPIGSGFEIQILFEPKTGKFDSVVLVVNMGYDVAVEGVDTESRSSIRSCLDALELYSMMTLKPDSEDRRGGIMSNERPGTTIPQAVHTAPHSFN